MNQFKQMKELLKISLVAVMITSCSCHEVFISEKDLQNDIFYLADQLKPYSGVCFTRFKEKDQIRAKRTYKEGTMNGITVLYYPNGQVNKKGQYRKGKYHGKWEGWYKDGTKSFEIHHNHGKLQGKYNTYHDNGQIKETGTYTDNFKSGRWQYFDKGGNLVEQKTY